MNTALPIEQWAADLQRTLEVVPGPLARVIVLGQTASTQDAAREMEAAQGQVIVTWRQTHGRGRLGRAWADTGEDGVAMTLVVPRDRPERMAIVSAVGVCLGIERLCGEHAAARIKWPNDIIAGDRKVAGILVEQCDDRALIGIGVNVAQTEWPDALAEDAISLAQLGVEVDRLHVMVFVLTGMQLALRMSDEELGSFFKERDALSGKAASFRSDEQEVRGLVDSIDPLRGLSLLTSEGPLWLPAATTTVLQWR